MILLKTSETRGGGRHDLGETRCLSLQRHRGSGGGMRRPKLQRNYWFLLFFFFLTFALVSRHPGFPLVWDNSRSPLQFLTALFFFFTVSFCSWRPSCLVLGACCSCREFELHSDLFSTTTSLPTASNRTPERRALCSGAFIKLLVKFHCAARTFFVTPPMVQKWCPSLTLR